MGGHSLLATRMFAEIQKTTGRKVPLSVLIQNPTVAELAAYLRDQPETDWLGLVPMREHGSSPPLFISHGLGSHLLLFRGLTEELGSDQPVYGIQLAAPGTAKAGASSVLRQSPLAMSRKFARSIRSGPITWRVTRSEDCWFSRSPRNCCAREKRSACWRCWIAPSRKPSARTTTFPPKTASLRGLLAALAQEILPPLRERHRDHHVEEDPIQPADVQDLAAAAHLYAKAAFILSSSAWTPTSRLFAERYEPQPIDVEGVLFVAEDEVASESVGQGWSRLLQGRLDRAKCPRFAPDNLQCAERLRAGERIGETAGVLLQSSPRIRRHPEPGTRPGSR